MIWKSRKTHKSKKEYYTNWHKWFAWYPITIGESDGRKIKLWLEYVERRGNLQLCANPFCYQDYYIYKWEYRRN